MFEGCPDLSDYYGELVATVASFSYRLESSGLSSFSPDPQRASKDFIGHARKQLGLFLADWKKRTAESRRSLSSSGSAITDVGDRSELDTIVVPFVQQGQFGLRDDEKMVSSLLSHFGNNDAKPWLVHFTSGYLNFPRNFLDLILGSRKSTYKILTASPEVRTDRVDLEAALLVTL